MTRVVTYSGGPSSPHWSTEGWWAMKNKCYLFIYVIVFRSRRLYCVWLIWAA